MTAVIFFERVFFFSNQKKPTQKTGDHFVSNKHSSAYVEKKDVAPVCGKNIARSVHFYGKDME